MRYPSPLRYPGGKAVLSGFLTDTIDLNDLRHCNYFEPFAGGAGAALSLLQQGVVSNIHLNDADILVYLFWQSAINEAARFVERIISVPLTIEEWKKQREICVSPKLYDPFDVGFAAFYMNRCNRSGILMKSGPIGGLSQAGEWRLDVRFNREELSARILNLETMENSISITCKDAIDFLKEKLPRGRGRSQAFVYLDPPYVIKGQKLYLNAYEQQHHSTLAKYMLSQNVLPWIMSYDDSELVRSLYSSCNRALLPIRYTLQEKRSANELIISPNRLVVPVACRLGRNESLLKAIA